MLGLDTRTTMDIDTTIKGLPLNKTKIREIFEKICHIETNDNFTFEIDRLEDIRENDEYGGIRVYFKAIYKPLKVPFSIDITTGDKITPKEITFTFKLMFDEGTIQILSYNIETILAEKMETILSRSIANRRIRDFYDIYILWKFYYDEININTLSKAFRETSIKRGTYEMIKNYGTIIQNIKNDKTIAELWKKYSLKYEYAKNIMYDDIFIVLDEITSKIF